MTIIYRDGGGMVAAELSDGEAGESVDFCDGCVYFCVGDDCEDRKIKISDLVRIIR